MKYPAFLLFSLVAVVFSETSQQAAVQEPGSAGKLLPNPSFEKVQTLSRGQRTPFNWEFRSWKNSQKNAQWGVDPSGRTGRCVTILSTNKEGTDAAWTARITVRPNTFYRLSGWIKTKDVKGAKGALLNIQNMQQVKTTALRGTHNWTWVSTVFKTADSPIKLEINCLFGGWGQSTGHAWYDDIAIEPIEEMKETCASVTIDRHEKTKSYSPFIFGGFIEHFHRQVYGGLFDPGSPLSDKRGFRKDVIKAMKKLKLSVVRWPGGCFASGYHWKKGVGKKRRPTDDMAWGVKDPNTFGTNEFVEWCRLVGCEPYICTNAGNGTPKEMSDWVEYCNKTKGPYARMRINSGHAEPFNIRLWSIGNENWGSHEIGTKSIKAWGPFVLKSAKMMKAVDPTVELTAAALPNKRWTLPLLKTAGGYLKYISIHNYWLGLWQKNATPGYLQCIMLSNGPEEIIANTIAILEEAGYRGRIKIAFDEWNLRSWHHPGFPRKKVIDYNDPAVIKLIRARDKNGIASQFTMADALFSASFLNACLRHADDVGMANISPIINTRGPLYVYPKGIVKRTTFHVLAMYANLLGNRVGKVHVNSGLLVHGNRFIPIVDAIATIDDSNKTWSIALVNRHPSKEVNCTVQLKNMPLNGKFAATVLKGDSPNAYNDINNPNRVIPREELLTFQESVVKLSPHSVTIVKIPAK